EQLTIREVYMVSITALEPGSVRGTRSATIECLEYARPTPKDVTTTPKPASADVIRPTGFDKSTSAAQAPPSQTAPAP
ncbi:MAG: hypothetical protein JO152_10030, partial [Mycobacteriaceae bacterium]|nr:hypothetical protein [Mycobacteriaceae bacterium]